MLTSIQSAGVTPEVNLRNSTQARKHASEKPTLALKPRADISRSPKQGYHWPHEKDLQKNCHSKQLRNVDCVLHKPILSKFYKCFSHHKPSTFLRSKTATFQKIILDVPPLILHCTVARFFSVCSVRQNKKFFINVEFSCQMQRFAVEHRHVWN